MALYQNKEWLENQYIVLRKSIQQIATELKIGHTTINTWLIKFNIPRRSNSEAHIGKKCSEEAKKKISKFNKGKIISEEHKRRLSEATKGKNNPNWKGGRRYDKDGYILIWNSKHPYRRKDNYIFEHRLVMEEHLGRYLNRKEVVHHEDENHSNNNIENLILFKNQIEHTKYHNRGVILSH